MRTLTTVLLLAGVTLAACGSSEHSESAQDSSQAEAVDYANGQWISDDFQQASAIAEEMGRPLLIDLYADWCGPCRTLGDEYFPSEALQPVLSNFVLLRVNVDVEPGRSMAQEYGANAIPTVVIAQADGTEIDRIVGITRTAEEYAAQLEELYTSI